MKNPRNNKMKASPKAKTIANLKTISPGVGVNKDYKPGKDAALDADIIIIFFSESLNSVHKTKAPVIQDLPTPRKAWICNLFGPCCK